MMLDIVSFGGSLRRHPVVISLHLIYWYVFVYDTEYLLLPCVLYCVFLPCGHESGRISGRYNSHMQPFPHQRVGKYSFFFHTTWEFAVQKRACCRCPLDWLLTSLKLDLLSKSAPTETRFFFPFSRLFWFEPFLPLSLRLPDKTKQNKRLSIPASGDLCVSKPEGCVRLFVPPCEEQAVFWVQRRICRHAQVLRWGQVCVGRRFRPSRSVTFR